MTLDLAGLAPPPGGAVDLPALTAALDEIVAAEVLAATPQDARYHAEGDVWLHTRMALDALVADPAYAALDPRARTIVFAAVLLHDVGKPATTRTEDDGRISSRGHSALGQHLVRVALWRAGAPFALREHVCALVRWHQVPFFAIDRSPAEAARTVVRMGLVTRNRWLALVATADARGRLTADPADRQRMLDHCALYTELAREHDTLDHPRPFPTAHTRVVWLADERGGRDPGVVAHDDTVAEAIITSGLPATGKSTWLRQRGLPVVSLDELRDELGVDPGDGQGAIVAAARERARAHLRAGEPFAWNATNLSTTLRASLVELCRAYRFRTHIVYCEVGADEQRRRNREREPDAVVPASAVERMVRRWSPPTPDEAHRTTYLVDGLAELQWPAWPPPDAI